MGCLKLASSMCTEQSIRLFCLGLAILGMNAHNNGGTQASVSPVGAAVLANDGVDDTSRRYTNETGLTQSLRLTFSNYWQPSFPRHL